MLPCRTTARRTAATGSTAATPAAKMCRLSSRSCWTVRGILYSHRRKERALHRLELLLAPEGVLTSETLGLLALGVEICGHGLAHQSTGILAIGGQFGINPA